MSATSVLLWTSLIISFAVAEDLMCYSCFYNEGHPYSDSSCMASPSSETLLNCTSPLIPGLQYGTNSTNMSTPPSNLTLSGHNLCYKFTGLLDGNTIVVRGCYLERRTFNFDCTNSAFLSLEGKYANATEACFCSTNKCNGSKAPRNDASCYHFTSNLLFAVTIYSIYKFVS